MRSFVFIFRWISAILLLVILLFYANKRQVNQKLSLNQIIIKESSDSFVNKEIVLNYLKEKSVFDNDIIPALNKEDLENLLSSHPAIKNVEVFSNQKEI